MRKDKKVTITINNQQIQVKPGVTILNAAREHEISIPSLCSLENLPSYGACRLCIVEVDGLRGFPTSCTTPVEEGMVIRTDTAEVRALRQEVLKLLLSEHPGSCLFCSEQNECKQFMGTIRKVGATTGCRYCPNDARCELQEITEKVGLTETSYPVYYRGFSVEKYDPFYDRDYNLCLLCGRCVRVCNDVRLNGTLNFKQRGKLTTIGPAFDRTHLESGCEFCGACVSVCPTGALSTKVSKWYGKPDSQILTTCTYCSTGCQLLLQIKNNEVVDVLPDYNSSVDRGLICVKGRFAIPEYVHSPQRISTPKKLTPVGYQDISWDEAIEIAAEKLRDAKPEESLIMVSPQLSNEDLFAAQYFARQSIGTENIFSSVIADLGGAFAPFLNVASHAHTFDAIDSAHAILTIGFDSTYGYSLPGISIKKASRRGTPLVTLNCFESNLDMYAEIPLMLHPSEWIPFLDIIIDYTSEGESERALSGVSMEEIARIGKLFHGASSNLVIVGSHAFSIPEGKELLEKVITLRDDHGWKVIVAHPYTNLNGMLAMGVFPYLKSGDAVSGGSKGASIHVTIDLTSLDITKSEKVVYLIGEVPGDNIPECDFLIYQNGLVTEWERRPDLILPSALFTETEGTVISAERRILSINKACDACMDAKPDYWIFGALSEKMKRAKINYTDMATIKRDMKKSLRGALDGKKALNFKHIDVIGTPVRGTGGKAISVEAQYRGIPLRNVASGMKVIEERVETLTCVEREG